jgi:hypothetical protein
MKILLKSLLVIWFLTAVSFGQNSVERQLLAKAERLSGDKFTLTAKTPKGAKVFAVSKPRQNFLNAIDKGLNDLFAVARKNRYSQRLKHSDYIIFIAKADRQTDSDGNYIPNFAIPVAQYAGTDYDKGGFMYAAGMVIANNPLAFMIAENEKKLSQVSEVVRYEGEHLVLYHNDRKRYNETADHSKGGGHPILN